MVSLTYHVWLCASSMSVGMKNCNIGIGSLAKQVVDCAILSVSLFQTLLDERKTVPQVGDVRVFHQPGPDVDTHAVA